ncbi:hypothetical protein ABID95_004417 [Streptomyces atratus]
MRFDRDYYLKIWVLTQPRINTDFPDFLLDEAQDTNPVVEMIFLDQAATSSWSWSATPHRPSTDGAEHGT